MALPAIDLFPGSSGDPLAGTWSVAIGSFEIGGGGTARSSAGAGSIGLVYWNADVFANDQVAQAVVDVGGSAVAGPAVRVSTVGGGQGYYFIAYVGGVALQKIIAGGLATTTLTDFGGGFTNGTGMRLRVVTVGADAVLRCELDTGGGYVQIGSDYVDSASGITSGQGGMVGYLTGALSAYVADNVATVADGGPRSIRFGGVPHAHRTSRMPPGVRGGVWGQRKAA